ncbi:MAG TPA: DUF4440 domain-containing protein [Longimicrobiales bacterium]|nr:DUF4440 domain-containing protein [Longimicrobiales bacterium]
MRILMTALTAGLVAGPLAAQQVMWPKPERTSFREAGSEVAITRVGGYPVVDVVVNGQMYRFALEMGGSFFGVSTRLAEALGLTVVPVADAGAGGPRATTVVDSVQLGGVVFYDVRAAVTDLFSARDWDGIVSPPLLRDVLYTLDLRNNRLRLERGALPAVDGRTVLSISRLDRGGRIDFPVDLGGVVVDPVIDTQSLFDVTIADSLERVLRLAAAPISIGQASGPSQGTFDLRAARLAGEAHLGATSLLSLPLIFRDRAGPVAGISFLEQFVITIDDANGRIRIVPHDTPVRFPIASWEQPGNQVARAAQSASTGRYMLGLRTSGMPSTVVSVEPGSNIARAGIRVGDVLLEVAGVAIERMTATDWQRVLNDGTPVRLVLARAGQRYEIDVTPIAREDALPQEALPQAAPSSQRQASVPAQSAQQLTVRAEIEQLNQSLMAAWQRNDAPAIAAHYSDDARIRGPAGHDVAGRANIDRYWRQFQTQGRTWTLQLLEAGGTPELAYQFGRSTISGGVRSQTVDFVGVWQRQPNGELKLAIDHWLPVTATQATPAAVAADAERVRELDAQWAHAYVVHDTALAGALLADNLVVMSGNGTLRDRQAELGDVRARAGLVMDYFRTRDVTVRMHGETAVVSGRAEWSFTSNGRRSGTARRYVAMYVRGGTLGWRMLALHLTGAGT